MRHRSVQKTIFHRQWDLATEPDENGQQMIEFAFTFTMLCALLMSLLLFGWVFFSYTTIVNAARDGSYYLMAHPLLPADPDTFATTDAEATWLITNSVPLLDWRNMTVNISPTVENRIPGSYVAVEIRYLVPLPEIEIPLGFDDTSFTLLGPMHLQALSRRSLD